jgi:hypothetical protein
MNEQMGSRQSSTDKKTSRIEDEEPPAARCLKGDVPECTSSGSADVGTSATFRDVTRHMCVYTAASYKKKGKAVPVTGRGSP